MVNFRFVFTLFMWQTEEFELIFQDVDSGFVRSQGKRDNG